jgi:hypothetical protein
MINHEALRMFLRKYREAQMPQLVEAMESNLMELLRAQSEFDRIHNKFVADVMYQCRGDKK